MDFKQGEIYLFKTVLEDREREKPVIIASNSKFNSENDYVYIVPLTIDSKEMDNTMFITWSTGAASTALCCNVRRVGKDRLSKYVSKLSEQELLSMKDCISNFFDIDTIKEPGYAISKPEAEAHTLNINSAPAENIDLIKQERNFYKQQYDMLLAKIIDRK